MLYGLRNMFRRPVLSPFLRYDAIRLLSLLNALRCTHRMDRLVGTLGVSVIDELGTVPASLLHADALRKSYGRCLRYNLEPTQYMHPQESWGRVFAKLLCGDFLQLPPVPSTGSFMAKVDHTTSYEHRQGRKLLMDMEYVVDFVNMQRFDDPLLVEFCTQCEHLAVRRSQTKHGEFFLL